MQTEHSSSLSQFVISLYHTDEFQLAQQTAALPSPTSLVAAMDLGIVTSKSGKRTSDHDAFQTISMQYYITLCHPGTEGGGDIHTGELLEKTRACFLQEPTESI